MSASNPITVALDNLMQRITETLVETDKNQIEPDPEWPSPCEYEHNGKSCWKPYLLDTPNSFENVESGLEITLNEEYKSYFTRYYANNIDVSHPRGALQLLQAWSEDDFTRLQQNLVGHLIMKTKLKQNFTLFFALTDEEDLNLVVDNDSGEVWLEYVGKAPHEKVADSLSAFLTEVCV
jgi:SecY interacting protein Syd